MTLGGLPGTDPSASIELPLSIGQRALWFLDRQTPGASAYVLAGALRVKGPLDVPALREAFGALADRHPALRTSFHQDERGEPRQRVFARRSPLFLEDDAADWDDAAVEARQSELAWSPFDLERDPLLRIGVLHRGPDEHRIVVALHHIVADFWSLGVLLGELAVLYGAPVRSARSELPPAALRPPAATYAEHVRRQQDRLAGPDGARLWEFWRRELHGRRWVLDLPTDRPRPPVRTLRGDARYARLDGARTDRLQALARDRRTTLFTVLLTAFQALLHRYTGEDEVLVGSPTAGRSSARFAGVVGYFVNPVVLRGDLAGDPAFTALLDRGRHAVLAALEHRAFPFPLLAERLAPERDPARSPVFQVMLAFEQERAGSQRGLAALAVGEPGVPVGIGGLDACTLRLAPGGAQVDLTLFAAVVEGRLAISLQFNPDLFAGTTAVRMVGHFQSLLAGITGTGAGPARRLSELSLLSAPERQAILDGNATAARLAGAESTLHSLLLAQAARTPDATAVVLGAAALSYGELAARARALAGHLVTLGVGPEVPVGICAERSLELVTGLVAILAAGGAYVPLDPSYPRERLGTMLADSLAPVVLVQAQTAGLLPAHAGRTVVIGGAGGVDGVGGALPASWPESLAYVIFTSGSTGRPKGAMNRHRSIVNRLLWAAENPGLAAADRVLQKTPVSFDVSVWELFWPLVSGACLVLARPGGHLDPAYLAESLARHEITVAHFVPAMLQVFLAEPVSAPALRLILASGEALSPSLQARFFGRLPGVALLNLYGPTEAAVEVTWWRCVAGSAAVPIGRPVANTAIRLLDRDGQEVPVGVPGELHIGGVQLARGYLGRPDLTAERFVPDSEAAGERLYRSGDLARRLAGGEIEYLGRVDHQVKIRGVRIEPGDIEAALAAHPAVEESVVVPREVGGEKSLVAYLVTAAAAPAPSRAELRAFLGGRLPEAMIPQVFVVLDALPLTPNGKVDRRRLPAPERAPAGERYVAPRTPVEELLCGLWAEVLGRGQVGIEDDFFALGGHSLLAMQVVSRVRQSLGRELPVAALFARPTVAGLALALAAGEAPREAPPLVRAAAGEERRVSFSQEQLWFLDQLEPGRATYNVAAEVVLRGALQVAAFAASLGEVVRRHEALRTHFVGAAGGPRPVVAEPAGASLAVVDLAALPEEPRGRVARALSGEEARRPFDLARGPVVRATLLRLAAGEHRLLFTLHHIACDGWSLQVLLRELRALYGAFVQGRPSPLPELALQYADYALWQRRRLTGAVLDEQLAAWRRRLAGAPQQLDLPTDRRRPAERSGRGAAVPVALPAELRAVLLELAGARRATLFMALLAGWTALLSRYSGQRDLLVGSPVANRTRPETAELIGFFVNTLVLRGDVAPQASFAEVLARARVSALEAYAHQELPFETLVDGLATERSPGVPPLVQVLLALEGREWGEAAPSPLVPGLTLEILRTETGTAKFDLSLELRETGETLTGRLEYSRDLFDGTTVERLRGHFLGLLAAAASAPERRLSELSLLTAAERQAVVDGNATAARLAGGESTLQELLLAQAARTPEATAVVLGAAALSYGELAARARRLAGHLGALGVGPEVPVGICAERSLELVTGLVAILAAGGAYVPLDPSYPRERLGTMLADTGAPVVLVQEQTAGLLPAHPGRTVVIGGGIGGIAGGGLPANLPRSLPESLAYVIFTSGSTGRPKGAMNRHRSIVNRLLWAVETPGLAAVDRVLQKTPVSFDVSVWEIFWPLVSGACLVLARPGGHLEPSYLADALARHEITVAHFVPAMLQVFLAEPVSAPALRLVLSSGEALSPALQERFFDRLPGVTLLNLYGPTEAAVEVTWWRCVAGSAAVPIGRPVANTMIRLLDRDGQEVPVGVPGELHIGGVPPARGYLGRPDLTAERFVPDAQSEPGARRLDPGEPGARLYRTGDLARRLAGGEIEYLGRLDHQVKIRGVRIEPGEIEAALAAHPAVREAVVVLRKEGEEKSLIAYLVTAAAPSRAELRAFLGGRLLEAMIPQAFVSLDAFPLTPSGKVDRRRLPAPEGAAGGRYVAPRTPVEELLCGIWAEILDRGPVGVEDDFFALGGHSLLATRVISQVRGTFGVDLALPRLFERPTVAGLAALIAARPAERPVPPLVRAAADTPRELSFSQERLWFLDHFEPGTATYNVPIAVALAGRLDVAALAAGFGEVVRRHEILRTRFVLAAGRPLPVVDAPAGIALPVVDLRALSGDHRERLAKSLTGEAARRPFDLERGPVVRTLLLRLAAAEHRLVLTLHHIACDGWSLGVLIAELKALYGAFAAGRPSPLPDLAFQYADHALWQRRWLSGEVLAGELAYWRERLAGAPALLELPVDRQRPVVRSGRAGQLSFRLAPAAEAGLRGWAARQRATLFMTALAAFAALLSRQTGGEDLPIGVPIAGRTHREVEGLIGFFVNTLVVRIDASGDPSFGALLDRVRATTLEAYAHQELPFERLVEELAPERSLAHSPLFQVTVNFLNAPLGTLTLPGLELEPIEVDSTEGSKFDLAFILSPDSAGVQGTLLYSRDLFDRSTVRRLLVQLERLLAASAARPEQGIAALSLLGAAERHQLQVEWNDTAGAVADRDACFHALFVRQSERVPDTVALVCDEAWVTYGELARRSGRLAGRLRALGVGPESRVAICAERSLAMMEGLLGILRAGGAYVALDPAHPRERLAQLLADVQSEIAQPVVLVQDHLAGRLPERPGHRLILEDQQALRGESAPPDLATPANAAYMIFTSGSTGRPKGVVVEHRQIVHYLHGLATSMGITGERSFALVQLITVDASKTLIFPPLARGGTLHLITQECALAPGALAAYLQRQRIHGTKIAPSHLTALQAVSPTADLLPEGWLIFGGEASRPEWAVDLAAARPSCRVFNHYGPTETTVGVTACEIKPGLAIGPSRTTHLGRRLTNARLYLLDRGGQPVPPGIAGEIYVGGPFVSRGYYGRPELTAERFVPDACGAEPGARLYRTGDLARLFTDGQPEFLGRVDDQVKIRGFRVELGEIAVELGRHPGVRGAVVLAPAGPGGTRRLVAYVVPRDGKPPAAELRRFLGERLPEYMVPQAFAFLAALPRSTHGKVDRQALAAIPLEEDGEAASYRAPRTPVEEQLAGIWGEVLKLDRVGIEDDFFALGGHSLLAVQVVSRIRDTCGVELALRQLFELPTIAQLAAAISGRPSIESEPAAASAMPPLVRQERPREIPLSFAQERLWFLAQLDPGSAAYNMPFALGLSGVLEPRVLAAVLGEVIRRHEVLRTSFPATAGRPAQVVAPPRGFALPVVDLAGLPGKTRDAEATRLAAAGAARPFDLASGPLIRAALLDLAPAEHVLLLDLHHIASDGWSRGVLIREVAALYPAVAAGGPSPLPELAVQYADFTLWQRGWLTGDLLAGEIAWWRETLAGLSPLELPTDRPRPPQPSGRGALHRFALGQSMVSALSRLALDAGATLFMTLLAGLAVLLARWSSQENLAVGAPVANRNRQELEPLIGFFVNTLVLRIDLAGDSSLHALLDRVRRIALAAYAHQDLPFEKLVEALSPERDASRAPLFQVLFTLQNTPREALDLPGLRLAPLALAGESAKFDLTLTAEETPDGLACAWEYNLDLFDSATVVRLTEHLERLLTAAAVDPRCRWSLLPLLSAAERHQLLMEWSDTSLLLPPRPLVHEQFSAQARRRPAATAVAASHGHLTYGEVEARSNRLAHHLRGLGVGPEALVAICMEGALDRVVSIVGALKTGGAYLPLDPTYPQERLAFVLADTTALVLLTERKLSRRLPATTATVICLDEQWDEVVGEERWAPEAGVEPENLAYVIYTSGSTGRPKGVEIRHAGLTNLVRSYQELFAVGAEDRGSLASSPAFDASIWELWPCLVAGASVHVPDPEVKLSPAGMVSWWSEQGTTLACLVTPLAEAVLAAEETRRVPLRLRFLSTGGDRLHQGPPPGLGFRLFNIYGPSEYTVSSTAAEVRAHHAAAGRMPAIGRPLANTRVLVLDRHLQPAPVGVPGELYVAGVGLARGYRKRPDWTAERFVPAPFAWGGESGGRLYRSGDLVRWLPDGELDFLGRTDGQVKVRGFRVELGEVEAVLSAHPAVRHATVLLREDVPGDRRLVAYVVPRDAPGPEAGELRSFLRDTLPEPMIPAAFVSLAALPVTANGKLDHRALPPPPADRRDVSLDYAAPESAAQRLVAALWREVLGIERVGLDDNFFDLGGHSLLVARVHGRLQEEVDPAPSMVDLFRFPTVRMLAEHLHPGAAGRERAPRRTTALTGEPAPIAIVGMAGRFPGAGNPRELWQNLCAGVESIRSYSADELLAAGVPPQLSAHPDYVPARGHLDGVELFDAAFFGYSPREAEVLDPQQRIFLECAWEALEDAGYDPGSYPGAIGVYAGSGLSSYLLNLYSRPDVVAAVGEMQTQLGNDKDFLATRVSYKLNLKGPSVGVQTACSTSLVAVHLACESLRLGGCDMALAGGVTIAATQAGYLYQEGNIRSPDGHCRAFDAAARGTVGGSGAGIVVLKRLDRALADGDSIYAVLRGSAINNDGSSKVGFTAPSVEGQAAVIAEAQAVAGVEPESIGYVEAHGTGTLLGDPIEVAALSQVLAESGRRRFCALGSLKTNIGHLDTAAGVAGLIKTALILRHGQIPPSLHFTVPNPQIDFANGPVYVNTELCDWPAGGTPRRAGVSAFGIGGTNAHAVLEEAPPVPGPAARPEPRAAEILLLSARSAAALETATDRLVRDLESRPDLDLADVAHTLQVGRRGFDHRRMLVCKDKADAVASLKARHPERLLGSVAGGLADGRERPVVFLLPGQGAQYVDMGRDLYRDEPVFRGQIDRCAELLLPRLGYDLRTVLYPVDPVDSIDSIVDGEEAARRMRQPEVSNPALFAVETALALLWRERGITPRAMIGYSFGEYVAAYLAGVFTLDDALALVVDRAAMLGRLPPGAMLAVPLAEDELLPLLGDYSLSLAAVNGPAVAVAAGPPDAIAELDRELASRGVRCRPVPMPYAAHSWMLDPLLEPFAERVARVPLQAPKIPYVSNTTGTWVRPEQATDPREWARHLRLPVRFAAGLRTVCEDPEAVFLEVGPGRGLGTLARANGAAARAVVSSMRHPREEATDGETLLAAQGRLWLSGLAVDWQGRERAERYGGRRRRVWLSTYPFERQRYWIDRGVERMPWMAAAGAGASEGAPAPAQATVANVATATNIEWEPGMSPLELGETLARLLAAGESQVVVSPRRPAAAAPGHGRPALGTPYKAPAEPLEEQLAALWERLLGIGGIGVHDNFYELGGHSLLATQLISRVREELGVAVPLEEFFAAPTIATLAGLVAQSQVDGLDEAELAELLAEVRDLPHALASEPHDP